MVCPALASASSIDGGRTAALEFESRCAVASSSTTRSGAFRAIAQSRAAASHRRETVAALADHGVEAVRKRLDSLQDLRSA